MVRRVHSELREEVGEYGVESHLASQPELAAALLRPLIGNAAQEVFVALLLDAKSKVTAYVEITRGTLSASLVHPREVFGAAVRLGAASIIVAHNHPSGDPRPSAEDVATTERLVQCGNVLGIPVLDHIVLGELTKYVSMRAANVECWAGRCT